MEVMFMKKNKYFKATLIPKSEEELIHNTFVLYLMGILEFIMIAVLQGEFNYLSISCLLFAGILLSICAYKLGMNSQNK